MNLLNELFLTITRHTATLCRVQLLFFFNL